MNSDSSQKSINSAPKNWFQVSGEIQIIYKISGRIFFLNNGLLNLSSGLIVHHKLMHETAMS